jgi:hypothetical protein
MPDSQLDERISRIEVALQRVLTDMQPGATPAVKPAATSGTPFGFASRLVAATGSLRATIALIGPVLAVASTEIVEALRTTGMSIGPQTEQALPWVIGGIAAMLVWSDTQRQIGKPE